MSYYYLVFLIFSLSGLVYADYKHKLFIFKNTKNAIKILGIGLAFFIIWDICGIVLDVFSTNQSFVSGFHIISPNMPVEELLFLSLFLINTALVWGLVCRRTS